MSDESSSSESEESLREYVDVIFTLEEALAPVQEQALHLALDKLPGIKNVSLVHKTAAVQYDPTETVQDKIVQTIEGAGVQIAEVKTTPSSPMTDALAPQLAPAQERAEDEPG